LEYTDAPVTETPATESDTMACPLCGEALAKDATHCARCDWTRRQETETAEGKASDAVAVLLSVIPGLGHIYKGHKLIGALFIIGAPFAVALSALAATATAGFGLGLMVFYWFAVMFHAYAISDRVAPELQDEGEQY
jgi:hypothetical protein